MIPLFLVFVMTFALACATDLLLALMSPFKKHIKANTNSVWAAGSSRGLTSNKALPHSHSPETY